MERVAALVNKTVKLSKGFIRLPLAMAHGMLSDLPIEYGIYSDLFGCIFFTLFSTSRHTSAGSAAFLMMIIGSSIESNFGSEGERNLFESTDRTFNSDRRLIVEKRIEKSSKVSPLKIN